jgi:hypothetical protein
MSCTFTRTLSPSPRMLPSTMYRTSSSRPTFFESATFSLDAATRLIEILKPRGTRRSSVAISSANPLSGPPLSNGSTAIDGTSIIVSSTGCSALNQLRNPQPAPASTRTSRTPAISTCGCQRSTSGGHEMAARRRKIAGVGAAGTSELAGASWPPPKDDAVSGVTAETGAAKT